MKWHFENEWKYTLTVFVFFTISFVSFLDMFSVNAMLLAFVPTMLFYMIMLAKTNLK